MRPPQELIDKHGHYHINPEAHAALRAPAEPAGRQFVVRTLVDPETGKTKRSLDWAPWLKNLTQEQKGLIFAARTATTKTALMRYLAKLGITDLSDPEQLRLVVKFGLKDRVDGWIERPKE